MNLNIENMPEKKATVLIVDDLEINRLMLESILAEDYIIEEAENGREAVDKMLSGKCKPSLVLLDIIMPEMNGFEVLDVMKANELTRNIPVILITAAEGVENELRGFSSGAIDYIPKPFNADIVKLRVGSHVELAQYRESLEVMVNLKVNELIATKENILSSMASLIEYRSLESGDHVKRTAILTGILSEALLNNPEFRTELIENDCNIMVKASSLHDIGKIAVPDRILLKPEKLTPDEFSVMETHTSKCSEIIEHLLKDANDDSENLYLRHCYDICRHHHERWDGKGYPDKIAGDDIPLSARIVSIIDVYDALVSSRVYKPAFSHEDALKMIKEEADNGKFDMRIVEAFFESEDIIRKVYNI